MPGLGPKTRGCGGPTVGNGLTGGLATGGTGGAGRAEENSAVGTAEPPLCGPSTEVTMALGGAGQLGGRPASPPKEPAGS